MSGTGPSRPARRAAGARGWPVRLAAWALFFLYGSAALAPFVASDEPYWVEAVDRGAYRRARTELERPLRAVVDLLEVGEAGFLERVRPTSRIRDFQAALEAEAQALRLRTGTMRRYLPAGGDALLARTEAELDAALSHARAGDGAAAAAEAHAALASGRLAKESLIAEPADAEAGPRVPGPPGVSLRAVRSLPLAAALGGSAVAGAVLWFGLLGLWVLRRRVARPGRACLVLLGLSGAAGFAWERADGLRARLAGGEGTLVAATDWKRALASGELEVTALHLPPLYFAYDETNLREAYRAPTWTAEGAPDSEAVDGAEARAATAGHGPPAPPAGAPVAQGEPGAAVARPGEPPFDHPLRHPLGTDGLGRDLLVRLLHGGRVSLAVGLASAALLLALGIAVGALAGLHGGRVDRALSRVIEVVRCFPTFFLIVTVVALIPEQRLHPLFAVVLVIALVGWTGVARLVRAEFLRARELDYVAAARSLGFSSWRIAFGHVLPNVLGPVLVAAAFAVASGVLIESGVSFLGFGVRHPVPSWGALLSESRSLEHWWLQVFPGLAIFAVVLATHVLGEALRARLDPRDLERSVRTAVGEGLDGR